VFIKINIRYLKTSIPKLHHKDCEQLQNLVIFSFTSSLDFGTESSVYYTYIPIYIINT